MYAHNYCNGINSIASKFIVYDYRYQCLYVFLHQCIPDFHEYYVSDLTDSNVSGFIRGGRRSQGGGELYGRGRGISLALKDERNASL